MWARIRPTHAACPNAKGSRCGFVAHNGGLPRHDVTRYFHGAETVGFQGDYGVDIWELLNETAEGFWP
jgi:hypothetical protein